MFSSLRVRLPLLFLAGVVIAGIVTTLIAVQLISDFERTQTLQALRREAAGIATLYSNAVQADFAAASGDSRRAPKFAAKALQNATNDLIYFDGPAVLFPGEKSGLPRINLKKIDWTSAQTLTFQFTPANEPRGLKGDYYAVASPLFVGGKPVGAIVIAKKQTEITGVVDSLVRRLTIAFAFGLLVAGALALYVSRRLVRPLLGLSRAADEVAGGNYEIAVPRRAAGEIGHLSERFEEMAQRLMESEARERNFLMSVSHELRTPLTAIRGHVAALSEGLIDDPEQEARSLEIVGAEAERLQRLVGDILDLAKLDAHRFTVLEEEVGMEHLVERAYETFAEQARNRSIDFSVKMSAKPVIVSDGDRVLQIVDNLLSNAFRATPDGGRIGLELGQTNGTIRVSVEDTGPGIAHDQFERLFRPFVSGDGGGTGLGLAIARELSLALGGKIELWSEVGGGSRFELILPAAEP
ncbi:MAG TPA: HAMP domain-containing sensor histidine kinase [Gaiellaceae bacterium]|nr:HAMP domain-containing sensor histidine kinase [Gaiellaceae bacterium]